MYVCAGLVPTFPAALCAGPILATGSKHCQPCSPNVAELNTRCVPSSHTFLQPRGRSSYGLRALPALLS